MPRRLLTLCEITYNTLYLVTVGVGRMGCTGWPQNESSLPNCQCIVPKPAGYELHHCPYFLSGKEEPEYCRLIHRVTDEPSSVGHGSIYADTIQSSPSTYMDLINPVVFLQGVQKESLYRMISKSC